MTDLLTLDLPYVTDILTGFLRTEIERTGRRRAVFGLSGGLDSAVTAALAVRALGADRALGALLPARESDPASRRDAERVAGHLGLPTEVVPVGDMAGAYPVATDDRRRGNLTARLRMVTLFDLSERDGAIVLGTSNKTELLLGYGTLYGDMASGINPIGDLYKTQVRALAAHLGLPDWLIAKPPTADLWAGQTDEGELGFTYAEADRVLVRYVDHHWPPAELVQAGFSRRLVERITGRVRRTQFKRRLPVIAKVSRRTIGSDFRYPRDWGT